MKKNLKVTIFIALSLLLLIAVSFGVVFFSYKKTDTLIRNEEYDKAYSVGKILPNFYLQSQELKNYCLAGSALQKGDYEKAKNYIPYGNIILPIYNPNKLNLEIEYQEAKYLLSIKSYIEAESIFEWLKELEYKDSENQLNQLKYSRANNNLRSNLFSKAISEFEELSRIGYLDSEIMVYESKYQFALYYLKNNELQLALNRFSEISFDHYKDSYQMVEDVRNMIYNSALTNYRRGDYKKSIDDLFIIVESLNSIDYKNTESYLVLILVHAWADLGENTDDCIVLHDKFEMFDKYGFNRFVFQKELVQQVISYGAFEDSYELLLSDFLIYTFLTDKWRDGSYYFYMYESQDEEYRYWSEYNIPWYNGDSFKIEKGIYMVGSDEDGWRNMYGFEIINGNQIQLYCYKNSKYYTMIRN